MENKMEIKVQQQIEEILEIIGEIPNRQFEIQPTIENYSIDDKVLNWNSFIQDIIEPQLEVLKEIYDKLPVNSHIPFVEENSNMIYTQRHAVQDIIGLTLEVMEKHLRKEVASPTGITLMLEEKLRVFHG